MRKKRSAKDRAAQAKAIQIATNKLIAYDDINTFVGEIQGLHTIVDMLTADEPGDDPRTGLILRMLKDMTLMTLHVRLLLERMQSRPCGDDDVGYAKPDWEEYMRNFNKEPDDEEPTS